MYLLITIKKEVLIINLNHENVILFTQTSYISYHYQCNTCIEILYSLGSLGLTFTQPSEVRGNIINYHMTTTKYHTFCICDTVIIYNFISTIIAAGLISVSYHTRVLISMSYQTSWGWYCVVFFAFLPFCLFAFFF